MALTHNTQVPCHFDHCVPASLSYDNKLPVDVASSHDYEGSMTSNVVLVGDGGTGEKTGGGDGGGRLEDVTIFIRSDQNGHNQEFSTSEGQQCREGLERNPEGYGHLRRKDDGYIWRMMLRIELPGKRKRGRPNRRFMDMVKEDMAEVEVTEDDTEAGNNWGWKIRCGHP